MPVFSYGFVQKNDKLYCFLKRELKENPYFDPVMFNENRFLSVKDPDIWKTWTKETSFCHDIDTVDFVFVVPESTSLKIPAGNNTFKTNWYRDHIREFVKFITGKDEISGSIMKGILIDGKPYKILQYASEDLPE